VNIDPETYDGVVTTLRAAGCVWAEDEADLLIENSSCETDLSQKVKRRADGEPLELVLGWASFRGLRIAVAPGVFIPRLRTEFLAGEAISAASERMRPVVVELCCGAGAISAAILNEVPRPIELYAADLDPVAVALARRNLGPRAHLAAGDLFAPLPDDLRGRVDVLVANVPYVPTSDLPFLPAESRDHEPASTVDGGANGLVLLERLLGEAGHWLAPGGRVLSEVSQRQAPLAKSIIAGHGLVAEVRADADRDATIVIASPIP